MASKRVRKTGRDTVEMALENTPDAGKLRLLTLDDLDGRTRAKQRAEELRESLISERGGIVALT
jgi:hypothetical protein